MKEIIKNRKGFTLVELLAVIVVLAIIILVAMPNVLSAMEKARQNAFVTEATEICKVAQNAYNTDLLDGNLAGESNPCYSLDQLVSQKHLDKNINGYAGSIQLQFSPNGSATTTLWLTNGMYKFEGKDCTKLSKDTSIMKPSNKEEASESGEWSATNSTLANKFNRCGATN